jgi:hypothetical protein
MCVYCIQGVTVRCKQNWGMNSQKQFLYQYVWKHLICELELQDYYEDTSRNFAVMCGQGLLVIVW